MTDQRARCAFDLARPTQDDPAWCGVGPARLLRCALSAAVAGPNCRRGWGVSSRGVVAQRSGRPVSLLWPSPILAPAEQAQARPLLRLLDHPSEVMMDSVAYNLHWRISKRAYNILHRSLCKGAFRRTEMVESISNVIRSGCTSQEKLARGKRVSVCSHERHEAQNGGPSIETRLRIKLSC